MRNNPTDPERALWYQLRMRRLDGRRFLRQKVIAGAIVDFVCPQAKLVIELDGGQHDIRKRADELRTGDLNRAGYRVIRFWNQDISNNIDGVLETISQALRANTQPPLRGAKGTRASEAPHAGDARNSSPS